MSAFDPLRILAALRSLQLMCRKIGITGFFLATLAEAAVAQDVVIRDRLSPTKLSVAVSGNCGSNRYSIELRSDGQGNILTLEANGRAVTASEIAKVTKAVRYGFFMYQPSIRECFWDRPNARMRLITDGPKSGGKPVWISFEVSPNGVISSVRED
jgi:hypothetical protein